MPDDFHAVYCINSKNGKSIQKRNSFCRIQFYFIAIRFKIQADPIGKRVRFNNTKKDLEFTVNATKEQQCIDIEQLYLVLNDVSASLSVSNEVWLFFQNIFYPFLSGRIPVDIYLL